MTISRSRREVITRAILDAFHEAGATGVHVPEPSAHPRKYLVVRDGQHSSVWVYCWSLTPGGRPSLPNEYRIQMTSVQSPLLMNPDGHTVLLGYDPVREVFAGYDILRHSTFTSGSPSVQVDITTLNQALQRGLSFQVKTNDEIVVGIRNDMLRFYCENAPILHEFGSDSTHLDTVSRAARSGNISDRELEQLPQRRQLVVRETARWSRSSSFRKQVLSAYDNRCAVTRRKLDLVDAAHILPVEAGSRSIDHVRNGIALSPTYHRAFDKGLIFLDDVMVMHLNEDAANELTAKGLNAGIDGFAAHLGQIHLPYSPDLHPDPYFIQQANEYRRL